MSFLVQCHLFQREVVLADQHALRQASSGRDVPRSLCLATTGAVAGPGMAFSRPVGGRSLPSQ
jgi:hypothetical protein